ncbi:hypothetical protein Pth03_76500 [Planotetraspora thailandica]|uniref:Uncharacterized protein n=1 Tax=Planotetraspora thailandica TaxID=487172 RepID=A0A8J3Y1Y0_9ACTN|nr:hypothetical protein [Planotetraspora thailandica]GII59261.1 hypothetical protein Pth03_76500 [Planotetraspora thailandica]
MLLRELDLLLGDAHVVRDLGVANDSVIRTSNNTVIATIPVGSFPAEIVIARLVSEVQKPKIRRRNESSTSK